MGPRARVLKETDVACAIRFASRLYQCRWVTARRTGWHLILGARQTDAVRYDAWS